MQILVLISVYMYTHLILNWFGDYRSLRFCAMASVVALFVFGNFSVCDKCKIIERLEKVWQQKATN